MKTFELVLVTHPTKGRLLVRKGTENLYEQTTSAKESDAAADEVAAPEAAAFTQKGSWYTALDADGNEVGKGQGAPAFFDAFPHLKPEGE